MASPRSHILLIPIFRYFSISGDLSIIRETLGCNYQTILLSPWVVVCPTGRILPRSLWLCFNSEVPSLIKRKSKWGSEHLRSHSPSCPDCESSFPTVSSRDKAGILKSAFDVFLIRLDCSSFSCWPGLFVALNSGDIYDVFSNSSTSSALVARGFFCLAFRMTFRIAFHESAFSTLFCITNRACDHGLYLGHRQKYNVATRVV